MKSMCIAKSEIELPLIEGEFSMIPFDLKTLNGLGEEFKNIAAKMMRGFENLQGTAHFTLHGRILKKGETLRRGGPHTDGNYDKNVMDWNGGGGNGWKIGENGPPTTHRDHIRLYDVERGGIIMASNYEACKGWIGQFDGNPGVGGDCSAINLGKSNIVLARDTVFYGNNHFIHESLPMDDDVHRVFARITLPFSHIYQR